MSKTPAYRTGDQALVREINLVLVMRCLSEYRSLSRAALAEQTGLNKSTVSSIVQELQELEFVHEVGLTSGNVGRPSIMLELNPYAGVIASAELGVDFISVKCANFAAELLWQHRESTPHGATQRAILSRLVELLQQAVAQGQALSPAARPRLLGVALGVPGLVDRASGTLLFAPNLRWENVPLCDHLASSFGPVPIFVDNEANLAALGEYFFGAAKGFEEVLFISAGVGLGGAVIRNGQIAKGKTGFASEFGHMTMDISGAPCGCGNRGCWETQVSQHALFHHARSAIERGEPSALLAMTGRDLDRLTVQHVVEAARQGDSVALTALRRVGRHLGIGIASLVNVFNPDLVLFGGSMSTAGEFLLPEIETEVRSRALRWNASATRLLLAQHGADACVIGGIAMVWQAVLSQPTRFRQPAFS